MLIVEIQIENGNPLLIWKFRFFLPNSPLGLLTWIQFTKYLLAYCVQRDPTLCFPFCAHSHLCFRAIPVE